MEHAKNTVLIIEQHHEHAEAIFHDIHEIFDHAVFASSQQEIRDYIKEHIPDLIITNPFFADGSGRSCIKALRNTRKLHATPIIVVSTLPEKQVKLDFYAQGADAYFEMPYDKVKFQQTVRNKLKRQARLLINTTKDRSAGFCSRTEFEDEYQNDRERVRLRGASGILGLVAPAGIDFVIRDHGLAAGNALISEIAGMMRDMCDQRFKATLWTQKSILFSIMEKKTEDILRGLEEIRLHYFEQVRSVTKLQMTPGLRAVIIPIEGSASLDEQVDKLSDQLIQISRDPEAEPVQAYAPHISSKRHIIIADPDSVSVNVISHRLKKEGFIVNAVQDPDKILAYDHLRDLAAILVDSLIPGGGIHMVEKIKAEPELNKVPVMLLSRFGHEEEIAEAFEAGAEDYILKPLSLVELSARVKRLVK